MSLIWQRRDFYSLIAHKISLIQEQEPWDSAQIERRRERDKQPIKYESRRNNQKRLFNPDCYSYLSVNTAVQEELKRHMQVITHCWDHRQQTGYLNGNEKKNKNESHPPLYTFPKSIQEKHIK